MFSSRGSHEHKKRKSEQPASAAELKRASEQEARAYAQQQQRQQHVYVKEASTAEHDASSAHMLSSSKAPALRKVWLPETNRGHRLLIGMGWKSGTGLGPTGTGRVEPVAAVPKTGRAGIGARVAPAPAPTRKRKAEASPTAAHQMTQAERKVRRLHDAQRDRAIGRELYSSAFDGYEALMS